MTPETIIIDPSKLPLDQKRIYMAAATSRANDFFAGMPDDTELMPLFHKRDQGWKDYLKSHFLVFDIVIITRTIGTVLRFDSKSGLPTPIRTLGQIRGFDADTLCLVPGVGEFQANLIVNLFKARVPKNQIL
jgi:hypothetical protein